MKTKKLLKIVKDVCSKAQNCSCCIFGNEHDMCDFSVLPEEWNLEQMERVIKYAKRWFNRNERLNGKR